MKTKMIDPGALTLVDCMQALSGGILWGLDPSCLSNIQKSAEVVNKAVQDKTIHYGINTGFGSLANTLIEAKDLKKLQINLVRSHCTGVGDPLNVSTVRLMLLLKINALARGFSGVRMTVMESLLSLLNADYIPYIPSKGSVGASGDLAPLAQMSAVLLGEGWVIHQSEKIEAQKALLTLAMSPLELGPKEGLALLNGTQASTALAIEALLQSINLLKSSIVIGSLTVEAVRASRVPFDERIHHVRGHAGQADVAAAYRRLLQNSSIGDSHRDCGKVQDPYSVRCQPQVLGACWDLLKVSAERLVTEANAVTDNPLVFPDSGSIISGGNFHAELVAFAADQIALALAELGSLAERRIALMMDSTMSSLPPFLVSGSGLNSGFMMTQVTAAALVSENKCLASPSSVDSIPTSANQEDHVSMATYAARRLHTMVDNCAFILAIEWICACQGLDFLKGLSSSADLEKARKILRDKIPTYKEDRQHAEDITSAKDMIVNGQLSSILNSALLDLG